MKNDKAAIPTDERSPNKLTQYQMELLDRIAEFIREERTETHAGDNPNEEEK